MQKKQDWDYLICSGDYRTFHKIYAVKKSGITSTETVEIEDPIQIKFSSYVAGKNVY